MSNAAWLPHAGVLSAAALAVLCASSARSHVSLSAQLVLAAAAVGFACGLIGPALAAAAAVTVLSALLLHAGQRVDLRGALLISFFVVASAELWRFLLSTVLQTIWPSWAGDCVVAGILIVLSAALIRHPQLLWSAAAATAAGGLPVFPFLWELAPDSAAEGALVGWMVMDVVLTAIVLMSRLRNRYTLAMELADRKTAEIENLQQTHRMLESAFQSNAALYHDMRHHLAALESTLQAGNADSALAYVRALRGTALPAPDAYSGDLVLDGIISAKLSQAAGRIRPAVYCQLPVQSVIQPADLAAVVGNLLENAVQGALASGETEPAVDLTIRPVGGMLMVRTQNACAAASGQAAPPDNRSHGWGLRSVRDIAARYDGSLDIREEQNTYCAIASLRYTDADTD